MVSEASTANGYLGGVGFERDESNLFFFCLGQETYEDLGRHWSMFVPRRPCADVFTSVRFQKTNTLRGNMYVHGLHNADKSGHVDLRTKNKQHQRLIASTKDCRLQHRLCVWPFGNIDFLSLQYV